MDDKNISNQEKKAPLGVKIVAIIAILFALYPVISTIIVLFQMLHQGLDWAVILISVIPQLLYYLIVAVCITITAVMFWKGKNWARIILLIFFVIELLSRLGLGIVAFSAGYSLSFSLLKTHILAYTISIIEIILYLFAIFYLIFNKKVKELLLRNSLKDMDDKNISNQEKKAPLGVKIAAIIAILLALYPTIIGIIDFFQMSSHGGGGWALMLVAPFLFLFLIVTVCITITAAMFWKGKNWARIILLIFFVIVILSSLWYYIGAFGSDYFSCIVMIVLSLSAIFYLIFDKKVKEFFKKQIV